MVTRAISYRHAYLIENGDMHRKGMTIEDRVMLLVRKHGPIAKTKIIQRVVGSVVSEVCWGRSIPAAIPADRQVRVAFTRLANAGVLVAEPGKVRRYLVWRLHNDPPYRHLQ